MKKEIKNKCAWKMQYDNYLINMNMDNQNDKNVVNDIVNPNTSKASNKTIIRKRILKIALST